MKFSIVSATSMFALAAASGTPAHAYVLVPAQSAANLYDLVHADDGAAAEPDRSVIAVAALQATTGLHEASFTGAIDRAAEAGTAFPLVPLGAAAGTPPDDDFASQLSGVWHWNAWQKALAAGVAQVAPLIGIIGNGSAPGEKAGSTVFIAQSSQPGFTDGNRQRPETSGGFSTSTATITVTGPANLDRRAGSGFSVAAPADAPPMAAASQPVDSEPSAPAYRYAPQPGPGPKGSLVAASFSNAVMASGAAGFVYRPISGQPAASAVPLNPLPTLEQAAIFARLIDVTLPIGDQPDATLADGTRTFLPRSVSANPVAAAARYVTSVLDAPPAGSRQTVEAFQIGPAQGSGASGGASTSVADPLRGKIMAGMGPLDNALALP